jgi:hypothetical protein
MRRFLISFALTLITMGLTAIVAYADNWPSGCC